MKDKKELSATEYLMSTKANKKALDESIKQLEEGRGTKVKFQEINLTNSELFKSFAEFEQDGVYIDLHNEFDCKGITFSGNKRQVTLWFKPNKHGTRKVNNVEVFFDDCIIEQYSAKLDRPDTDSGTLDTMYRGRFETSKGQLGEMSDTGRYYYYINFLPDLTIELFAKSVKAEIMFT